MLFSFALIFLIGMIFGEVFDFLKLPKLLGMLLAGILLGPHMLNVIDSTVLNISTDLRQVALIIILVRAGLNLDINDLKKIGRPAILMCFVPACFEIFGMLILGPAFLGLSLLEAAIMGTVVAAVSPAVIVPQMLKLLEEGYGTEKGIPQMIMAGASVDDVFVIVLFTAFTGLAQRGSMTLTDFLVIPTAIIFGLSGGALAGWLLSFLFSKYQISNMGKIIIILSCSFLFITLEQSVPSMIGFSGLLAVMALGVLIRRKQYHLSRHLSKQFSDLWQGAEILLFVLVGASVSINYLADGGILSVLLIAGVMLFRLVGVFVSLLKTKLNAKERVFSAFAYMPKATVQAAIGGLPLAMGLTAGESILTIAVLSIIITAPIGALLMEHFHKKLLVKEEKVDDFLTESQLEKV